MARRSFVDWGLIAGVIATYAFLYIPLLVLMVFSFNSIAFPYRWKSFTWQWYQQLFESADIWIATKNSLIVASSAVALSLFLGLCFVLWSAHMRRNNLLSFFYVNLFVPEIVVAVGLLSFFVFFNVPLGLTTLIVGHTLLGLGYVVPVLHARFASLDKRLVEASLDLG